MRRKRGPAVAVAVLGLSFALGFGATAANAATVDGNTMVNSLSGKTYNSYNRITTFSDTPGAGAIARSCVTSGTSPAGNIGAKPRLFKGTALYAQADIVYSSSSVPAGSCYQRQINGYGNGSWYSHGWVTLWNTATSGYVTANIARSPSLNT